MREDAGAARGGEKIFDCCGGNRASRRRALHSGKILAMEFQILTSEDAAFVLRSADVFLSSEPVLHNLILSILLARSAQGGAGRYWMAVQGEKTVGVAIQSPVEHAATLTPMQSGAVAAMVKSMAEEGISLPGVSGDATTAACFAGQWSEQRGVAAMPFQGLRLYELLEAGEAPRTTGRLRQAGLSDRDLMVRWTGAFQDEIGEPVNDLELRVERGLGSRNLWVWEDGGEAVSMTLSREAACGVVRLSGVYTPPEKRGRGYAGACVHSLSRQLVGLGYRCILYTDLGNPTSNSIYKRIGYRAVGEGLRYRFV